MAKRSEARQQSFKPMSGGAHTGNHLKNESVRASAAAEVAFPLLLCACGCLQVSKPAGYAELVLTSTGTWIRELETRREVFLPDRWLMTLNGSWLELRRYHFADGRNTGEKLELYRLGGVWPFGLNPCQPRAKVWCWTADDALEATDVDESTTDLGRQFWYHVWRLHPTFVQLPYLSCLKEESGYAGGAHEWSEFEPRTIDLRTMRPLRFRDLFDTASWPSVKKLLLPHIMSICWDVGPHDEADRDRDAMLEALQDAGERPFMLTYTAGGLVAHLVYNEYEVHCYALGGVWLAIELAHLPAEARAALIPGIANVRLALPAGLHLTYPDMRTQKAGVRPDPRNEYGHAIRATDWLVGAWCAADQFRSSLFRAPRWSGSGRVKLGQLQECDSQ